MIRIALCDDEAASRDALRIQLESVLIEGDEEVVYEFSSGTGAASWLEKHPGEIDLLFLDVEMKGQNGMETAEKIRQFDENLIIVFVTGHADYVFDGYHVGALDYMMKPVTLPKLKELLRRVREKMSQEKQQTYTLKNTDGTWRFHFQDILYFYSDKRKVYLVTEHSEYPFYAKLDDIEEKLNGHFVRIHQRFLVNPKRVDYLGSDCVTMDDAERKKLPCSRKYKESATTQIARSMMGDF